jgi:hypothetical protein
MDTDKKHWKDVQIIKHCTYKGCGVRFEPKRFSYRAAASLCLFHWKKQQKGFFNAWWKGLTQSEQWAYKTKWQALNIKRERTPQNKEKHKVNALNSYHRNKVKNKEKRKAWRHEHYIRTGL